MRRKLALLLSLMMVLTPIYASSLTNKKEELSSTKQEIKDTKNDLAVTEGKKQQIKEEIRTVDTQIVEIQNKINDLEWQLEVKEGEIAESEKELEEATEIKDRQYEDTKKRMVQMYKNRKLGYLQVIFSSGNFWEAINRMEYIKRIAKKDNNTLEAYEEQIQIIDQKKLAIEEEKVVLDELFAEIGRASCRERVCQYV